MAKLSIFSKNTVGNGSDRTYTTNYAKPVSEKQIQYLEEIYKAFIAERKLPEAMKLPTPRNMQEATELIKKFSAEIQILTTPNRGEDKLIDLLRFGLITLEDIEKVSSEFGANELYSIHRDSLKVLKDGRCTTMQYKKIVELQTKLRRPTMDIYESIKISMQDASNMISDLQYEINANRFARLHAKAEIVIEYDNSRSRENEYLNSDFEAQERSADENLHIALLNATGCPVSLIGMPDFDTISDLKALNQELINLVVSQKGEKFAKQLVEEYTSDIKINA